MTIFVYGEETQSSNRKFDIIDNNNIQKRYLREFFIPLEEFREKKLLELGI